MVFVRPEHGIIVDLLGRMDAALLSQARCFFGGGTAIVLKYGEYRRSLDIDFLCSDQVGYRNIRNAVAASGVSALFPVDVRAARAPRLDQYGIRLQLVHRELTIKFEIVREARVELSGDTDPELKVPTLHVEDMFTEKLLANADRCFDPSVAYRDALDLGKLVEACGTIPDGSVEKAEHAYGADIQRKLAWTVNRLRDLGELDGAAGKLDMSRDDARSAIGRLREETRRLWPSATLDEAFAVKAGR
jgi:hypothetical protein